MRILAIDPGYDRLGVAVVEGSASKPALIMSDCVVPAKGVREERLAYIARIVVHAIQEHVPDVLAIEKLFFSKNKKTAIGVAEARGVILSAGASAGLVIIECSPQQVKMAVTGYGNADKTAIARMVPKLIALPHKKKRFDDEFDAIALGIAALAMR